MDVERWQRIEQLFHDASALAPHEQQAWLTAACGGDAQLQREVMRLLEGDQKSETVVRNSIAAASNDLITDGIGAESFRDTRIGAWRIDHLLGEGGMGLVFLAHRDDGRFEQNAAIKLLRFTLATPAEHARFHRERRILARLDHPHIARLLDAGEHRLSQGIEIPYFVMELVDGEPLTSYARQRSLNNRQRIELFQQVLDAVGFAHQRFVLHRDLKPVNILVTKDGVVKLLDFGISQLMEGDPSVTPDRTRSSLMTPDYASPEQLRGDPLTVQSDVFTLGALLYELLADRRAFELPTMTPPTDRAFAMAERPAPSLGIDADLDTIVAKAIHADLSRRYQSVEALADDLRRYLEGQPVSARKDSGWYRTRKFIRRHRWGLGAAAVVMLSLAAGVVTTAYQARRANEHLAQLRQLSGRLLFQVHDAVENLQGATEARALLVTTSAEYLDALSASAGNDPAFLLDLAAAYERVGRILGGPNAGHLGRVDESIAAYRKAIGAYERLKTITPDDRQVPLKEAHVWLMMGRVQNLRGNIDEGLASLQKAYDTGKSVAVPGRLATADVLESLMYLGDSYFDKGQPREALKYYNEALQTLERGAAEQPTLPRLRSLSNGRMRVGQAEAVLGNLTRAREIFQQALDRAKIVAAQNPTVAPAQRDVYIMYDRLGTITGHPDQPNLDDPAAAARFFDEGLAQAEKVAAADPKDIRAKRDLAEMLSSLGTTLRDIDPPRSRATFARAFQIYDSLPAATTNVPTVARWIAEHHRNLGVALANLKQKDAALAELQGSLKVFRDQGEPHPIGITLTAIARVRLKYGELDQARASIAEAITLLEGARKNQADDMVLRRDLGHAYVVMAGLAAAAGDCGASRDWLQKSADLWTPLRATEAAALAEIELKKIPASHCG